MGSRTKDLVLTVLLVSIGIATVCLAVLIPTILAYKVMHGGSLLRSATIFIAYLLSWVLVVLLNARYMHRSAVWGILFGLCFYGLLYCTWAL